MTELDYYCPRCGYNTSNKNNFIKHLNRTHICKAKYNDISIYEIINDYSFDINKFSNRINSKQIFQCNFCDKIYSTKYSLDRHKLNCAKNTTLTQIDLLQKELKLLKAKKSSKKYKMKQQNCKNYKTDVSGSHNNIINGDNIVNNNNITINNYGSENLDYITAQEMMKIIFPPSQSILKLSNMIHLNDEHPENKNIVITNIGGKHINVKQNNKWKKCFKSNILPDIIDSSFQKLEHFYEKNNQSIPEHYIKRLNNYYNTFVENEEIGIKLAKEFELHVYNETNKGGLSM